MCVGESLAQREQGVTEELVRMQTKIALQGVSAEEMQRVVIAYEPVWAIGTGRTATSEQAQEVCAAIRKVVGELYGQAVAEATTVQYGGSMNAGNAKDLMSMRNIDGGLIGGASLKAPISRPSSPPRSKRNACGGKTQKTQETLWHPRSAMTFRRSHGIPKKPWHSGDAYASPVFIRAV